MRFAGTHICLSLFVFPLGFATLAAMASRGIEHVLKEMDDLDSVQKIRSNAFALPKLFEAMEHKINLML